MKDHRFAEIKALCEIHDKLPDGAFLAVLEENGVDADDLMAYAREREKRERALKVARRK